MQSTFRSGHSVCVPAILFCVVTFQSMLAGLRAADDRPNIVMILADDLGYETVGCYGGTSYGTPNLDRLAASGMRFDNAYAMPLCTNTRIQLMTGRYNNRNWSAFGILDPNEASFGTLLQRAGYKTCIAGKWQLTSYDPPDYPGAQQRRNTGVHPKDAGFDEYCLWHVGHTETKGSRYADPVIEQNGSPVQDTQGKYGPDLYTDFIGDFINRHREEPFFVYYSMALPHNPMVPTPDSPEWADPARRHSDETPFAADMIRYTDKMVGKVVAQLEDAGLAEDTLVLFFSDNGTNWRVSSELGGRMVRGGKSKPTQLGVRVPAIAYWPGTVSGGRASQAMIDSVDFLPTMLGVASPGQALPENLDGISFLPVLKGEVLSTRDWVYIHQDPRPGWDKDRFGLDRLAINQRYKLHEDGRLYDLVQDPFESRPHFISDDTPAERTARRQLQTVLDQMKPYPMFDPAGVPRPDPRAHQRDYHFQDWGGLVVIEAEALPIPRDESWRVENHLPDYLGTGYLRALRDQSDEIKKGATRVPAIVELSGSYHVAVRCRTDHSTPGSESEFWIAHEDRWMRGVIPEGHPPGTWCWVTSFEDDSGASVSAFSFKERGNVLWLAPAAQNLKVDRIVLFQDDQADRAMSPSAPASDYHPWASP